jgi:hypothetical protein
LDDSNEAEAEAGSGGFRLQFEQGMTVRDPVFRCGVAENIGVTGSLAVHADPKEREPEHRIEPVDGEKGPEEGVQPKVASAEVEQLVAEDQASLGGVQLCGKLGRQEQGGVPEAAHGRAIHSRGDADAGRLFEAGFSGQIRDPGGELGGSRLSQAQQGAEPHPEDEEAQDAEPESAASPEGDA